jgi:hypothetical protein
MHPIVLANFLECEGVHTQALKQMLGQTYACDGRKAPSEGPRGGPALG